MFLQYCLFKNTPISQVLSFNTNKKYHSKFSTDGFNLKQNTSVCVRARARAIKGLRPN